MSSSHVTNICRLMRHLLYVISCLTDFPPHTHARTHTRVWRGHVDTDTDDTDLDYSVGGLGFYSHKSKALTHNHWVDQVTSAGGFNVHDTQAGEASHKTNMGLASLRVRHGRGNTTQGNMHQYLRNHTLFREVTLLHR